MNDGASSPADECLECGFRYDEREAPRAGVAIRDHARTMAAVVVDAGDGARIRPRTATWSALEYGCHTRDVLIVQRERVLLVRRSVQPPAPVAMGRDERVAHDGYADQHPGDVARQLVDAAALFANVLDRLDETAWARTLFYNAPAPAERTLRWVAVHTVHELRHHLQDVQRGLLAVERGSGAPAGS